MSKIYAIILAGGTGLRMGSEVPKQFLSLSNLPVMVHTILAFQNHHRVNSIMVVIHQEYINKIKKYKQDYNLSKIKKIIKGGKTRQESSYNAITGYRFSNEDILLFHDAARPLISDDIIELTIEETIAHNAVNVCVETSDTIVQRDENDIIVAMPQRNQLRNSQTPQAFRFEIIKKAHEYARQTNFTETTDDVRLVMNIGHPVKIIKGNLKNIKITTPIDMLLAEAIISNRKKRGE